MDKFKLVSNYSPMGDQPQAIDILTSAVTSGLRENVLLGVTGSGKTFTMANIIANLNRPTLILAHNKTLAAQLCSEFREYFPENAVEYFVSYYDYFQPEAYIPGKDIYIEKDSSINDEIDKMRHSATSSLFERRDVIIVASVSCIYTLGDPEEYKQLTVSMSPGKKITREQLCADLVSIQYERNDIGFERNKFRVRGDVVDVFPAESSDVAVRVEFFGDEIDRVCEFNPVTGEVISKLSRAVVYPATHYVTSFDKRAEALVEIETELEERVKYFKSQNKFIEAQRIEERTKYDLEMIGEIGYCSGVENYSRVLSRRAAGSTPFTLLDYFPKDFLMFIDESHVTLPQVRGMSGGDKARKKNLIDFGFRLPSAYDNRPLVFDEFTKRINQVIYVSATPTDYEKSRASVIAEQVIRPTGLLDPKVEVRPIEGQIDDLISEINIRTERKERVLVTTLTRKMSEDLTEYLETHNIKCRYMHFGVDTVERMELLRDLRLGVYDVLVGINLLREGLDLPEVSLVAILDADKEGFLRSDTSLIQTIGRAARNSDGTVIMYANKITNSMKRAIDETERRREKQKRFNAENGIIPKTIVKEVHDIIDIKLPNDEKGKKSNKKLSEKEKQKFITALTEEMKNASKKLDFETAAYLRDKIIRIKEKGEI